MKAVSVVRHLFYTSKIILIVLELNHLIYIYTCVYCIYIYYLFWLDTILYFRNTVDSS